MRWADYGEKLLRNFWQVKQTFFAVSAALFCAKRRADLRFA